MKKNIRVIGYDLNYDYCQISYSGSYSDEPETLYLMDEKEGTELPMIIARPEEGGNWVTGMEAKRLDMISEGIVVKDLLRKSLSKEKIKIDDSEVSSVALLAEYIKLSLQRIYLPDAEKYQTYITFTTPTISEDTITLLKGIASHFGIPKNQVYVQDYKESFYDYIWHQPRELWNYEVALFGFENSRMYAYKMVKEPLPKGRKKELVSMKADYRPDILIEDKKDRDFMDFVRAFFGRSLISSVFLIGREFEDDQWYHSTLQLLCNGRRVFRGRNLYSKGACYGGFRKIGLTRPDAIYLDQYKIASQISLRLRVGGKEQWYPIVFQGENWYEINRGVEILVDQGTQLLIQIDTIGKNMPKQEAIPLVGLFETQRRTTRLHLEVIFLSKNRCRVLIHDVDFGEIKKATGYELTHTLQLDSIES